MAYFERIVHGLARELDRIAGWAIVAMMALVVVNVILRRVWHPILGTTEFVGFLAAVVIGFAIAYCAALKGHIAVTFIADRFPQRTQAIIDVIIGIIAVLFFGLVVWQIGLYATDMVISGEVSPTIKAPFFIFVYGVAFGILALWLVLLVDLIKSVAKAVKK